MTDFYDQVYIPLLLISVSACGQIQTNNNSDHKISDTTTYIIAKPAVSALLIDPGKGVGKVKLNADANKLADLLGAPDHQDSGMGSTMMTWFAGHDSTRNSLTVYAKRNMGGKDENVARIKQIRITSPEFKTIDSVRVGSNIADIKKVFNVQMRQSPGKSARTAQVWADRIHGIAFEVDGTGRCTAIRVHQPYDNAAASINMKAD